MSLIWMKTEILTLLDLPMPVSRRLSTLMAARSSWKLEWPDMKVLIAERNVLPWEFEVNILQRFASH